jgi:hypothetical protein
MTPETWYLVAAASAVAAACAIPPLWRWCAGVDKPKPLCVSPEGSEFFDRQVLLTQYRNLWLERSTLIEDIMLAVEQHKPRKTLRAALAVVTNEMLDLEVKLNPDAYDLAMLTGSVTSDPGDPS